MAAPMEHDFEKWLSKKLTNINPEVDLDVFVTYITGILETEDTPEDQEESINGLLAEICEDDVEHHCKEIVNTWGEQHACNKKTAETNGTKTFEDQIHSIVEKQQSQKIKTNKVSAEAKARKAAILAQYGHESNGEETDEEDGAAGGKEADQLYQNVNALAISQREQEVRIKMKEDHENKKQKDKDDRERQKQKAVDRKEAEKKRTQKGEKRR